MATPQPVIDQWTSHLRSEGVDLVEDPSPVVVEAAWSDCERAGSLLWGSSGGVAQVDLEARLALNAEQEEAVSARLDELLDRQDWGSSTNWRDPDLRKIVEVEDGHLHTRLVHPCLPPEQQQRAEEELSALLASWLLWLADTDGG